MSNVRKNLAVKIATPGGDNPLLFDLVRSGDVFAGVPCGTLKFVGRGGTPPYAFSMPAVGSPNTNVLPDGFPTLPVDGDLTGSTATTAGHYAFLVQIADSDANTHTQRFAIDVKAPLFPYAVTPTPGEIGIAYSYRFIVRDAAGNDLTTGYSDTAGTVPAGLTVHSNGIMDGTPTAPFGTSNFTLTVTDGTNTIDIPITVEIADELLVTYAEDRNPPIGWGGGDGTWLPSMIRGEDWSAHLVITGGVGPYALSMSEVNPAPENIKLLQHQLLVAGRTTQAAQPDPWLTSIKCTDRLGAVYTVQRAAFIVASEQSRIIPQLGGTNVGKDGFTKLNVQPNNADHLELENDGDKATFKIPRVGLIRARLATTTTLPANTYANGTLGVSATLTGNSNAALASQDGVTPAADDVLLIKDESSASHNGAYIVTQPGDGSSPYILTRHPSMDTSDEFGAMLIAVGPEGTTNKNTVYQCTVGNPTVGSTAITFQAMGGGGGISDAPNDANYYARHALGWSALGTAANQPTSAFDAAGAAAAALVTAEAYADTGDALALKKASNLSDVASASTSRTNLGLGTSATHDVPASGNATATQVVLGNDTRLTPPKMGPGCIFGNGGLLLSGTLPSEVEVPYAFAGTGWTIVGDATGSGSIVVSHSTYSAYDTMTTLFTATISSAKKNQATGLTYSLAAGDIIRFSGSSFSGFTRCSIQLDGTPS